MKYKERIPEVLFREDGHFLGKPADFTDRIVTRRIRLLEKIPDFTGTHLSLLDIGCGNGASIFLIANKMKRCLGLEVTDEHRADFNNYKEEHNCTNCDYQITDITKNKPTEKFDRIISFEVIEHLETEDGVDFYYNSLNDGGLMAISVPNKWWVFETHGARLPILKWNRVPFFSWLPRIIHEKYANARIYTKSRIKKLLEKHGFEVISCTYITAPMDVLPDGKFKNFVISNFFKHDTTNIPFKSTSLFVVAKKSKRA